MQFNHFLVLILFHIFTSINCAPTDPASPDARLEAAATTAVGPYGEPNLAASHKRRGDYYEYRHVVAEGVQKALDECRQKFKWDRWNCPKKAFLDILGRNPLPSNKELGLTRALIASGIVLSLIRSCSFGTNSICGCSQPTTIPVQTNGMRNHADDAYSGHLMALNHQQLDLKRLSVDQVAQPDNPMEQESEYANYSSQSSSKVAKFAWGGCDEIVRLGFKVAKIYLDSQDASQDEASKMINTHNYEVGRQAVRKSMKRKCKCHGVSGACQVNTCWTVVPDMSEVGEYLKRQYRVAAKVGAMSAEETNIESLTRELSVIDPDKLVFTDASPDYCYENHKLGINGTLGRYCSRAKHRSDGTEVSRSERDSCDRLCTKCGYKIKRERLNVEKQCDCRFVYCCSVECKRCPHVEDTYKCVRHS